MRSFVRREGRITPAQQRALEQLWPTYGIEYTEKLIDSAVEFHRAAPLSIDIGFGNGLSTLHIAQHQPHWNHLGIEVYRSGVGSLLKGIDERELGNVRAVCADAVDVLTNMVPDESVDRFLIFFPDPWPKKRHHKRRLVQPEFANLVAAKLNANGIFHLATDWQPYAEWMLAVLDAHDDFTNLAGMGQYADKPDYRPQTKFEARGQNLGHGVFDLIYQHG